MSAGVAASIAAVSTSAILIRLSEAPPLLIAFHRLLYATILLGIPALVLARAELRALRLRDMAGLALVGAVLAVHFASWIASLAYTSVASSVVLVTLHPALVAVVSARVFGEGVGARGYAGIGLALIGGAVLTLGDAQGGTGPRPLLGDALALVGAVAAAIYFLAGRGYRRRLGLLAYVTPVYGTSALVLGAMALVAPPPASGALTGYPVREHALFLLMALVPMVLGHTVLNWALRYVTAPVIATTVLGEPVGATLLAWVVLNEVPPATSVVGGGIVLAGIALVTLTGAGEARQPQQAPPT